MVGGQATEAILTKKWRKLDQEPLLPISLHYNKAPSFSKDGAILKIDGPF